MYRSLGGVTLAALVFALGLGGAGCEAVETHDGQSRSVSEFGDSGDARARILRVRERWKQEAVLDWGIVSHWSFRGTDRVVPVWPSSKVSDALKVSLPARARGFVEVLHPRSQVAIRFSLRGTTSAPLATSQGVGVYAGAYSGRDVFLRVHPTGTEDFVVFEDRPETEELVYELDVSDVAGIRLVANTMEFLDERGVPRLRVPPPGVKDALGNTRLARLAVEGCVADHNPAMPWIRPVVPPGSASCTLRVSWDGGVYPMIVDPAWVSTGSMAIGRNSPGDAVLTTGGAVLVVGGSDDNLNYHASAELYDIASGTFAATASMHEARNGPTVTLLPSGQVLVAGGYDAAFGFRASAELYDPTTGLFSLTGAMADGRVGTATALPSGKVLVAGHTADVARDAAAELYDPATGTFEPTGPMSKPRESHTATLLNDGKVLIAGGNLDGSSEAELYDPATQVFALTGALNTPRFYHVAALLPSGRVLVAGGGSLFLDRFSSTELYDPETGMFASTAAMTYGRYGATASVLPSGEVLVAGGYLYAIGSETYDPLSETFGPAVPMQTDRGYHTALVLPSGKVLVAGGSDGRALATAEIFESPQGARCTLGSQCGSGFCADNVCCDTACAAGNCDACSIALGADANGTCKLFSGVGCDDANACTQTDVCAGGVCIGSDVLTCNAPDECHVGACEPATGNCASIEKANGAPCSAGTCQDGNCAGRIDASVAPTVEGGTDGSAAHRDGSTTEGGMGRVIRDGGDSGDASERSTGGAVNAGGEPANGGAGAAGVGGLPAGAAGAGGGRTGAAGGGRTGAGDGRADASDDIRGRQIAASGGCTCQFSRTNSRNGLGGSLGGVLVAAARLRRRRTRKSLPSSRTASPRDYMPKSASQCES